MKSLTLRLSDELYASLCAESAKLSVNLTTLMRLKLSGAVLTSELPNPSAPAHTPAPAYVPPVAGKQPDAYILDHLFDDEDPPPYDETVGLKLTTDA